MSTYSIPNSSSQIRQIPNSDTLGELWETFNIDLTTVLGKIKTSQKLTKVLDEDIHLGTHVPVAFAIYKDKYYLANHTDEVFKCLVTADITDPANWTEETGIPGFLFYGTDMVVFDDKLLISGSTDITTWNGTVDDSNWWTTVALGSALTGDKPHTMHVFRGGKETLFVTDGNKVHYYNTSAGASQVTLQTDLTACCVTSGVSATWVGTYTESQENAYVYEIYVGEQIDAAPVARNAYKVDGRAVLSIQVLDNVPYIMTEKGNLQAFNGAGFTTVASLPFTTSDDTLYGVRAGDIQDSNRLRPIHPKGIQAHNDSLFLNINTTTENQDNYPDRTPSGIWEYNKNTQNLTHRFAFCNTSVENGGHINDFSGPIMIIDNSDAFLIASGGTSNTTTGMFAVTPDTATYAYFITPEIESNTIQDTYEAIYLKADTLRASETIKVKYRITHTPRIKTTGAFLNTTTLNTTTDLSTFEVGDEVTILDGTNTGKTAHITAISISLSVTSLELDTAIGIVGAVDFEVSNFKLLPESYTNADGEYKKLGVGDTSPWIQFKVQFNGAIEMRQFISKGNSKTEV